MAAASGEEAPAGAARAGSAITQAEAMAVIVTPNANVKGQLARQRRWRKITGGEGVRMASTGNQPRRSVNCTTSVLPHRKAASQ